MKRAALPAWSVVALLLGMAGCAMPVKQVPTEPIRLVSGKGFILSAEAQAQISTGYDRKLRPGTHWLIVGTIPQGEVYRSADQTLTVEGYNVHEAYLVVGNATLVGFYLPVEKTFVPTTKPVPLQMTSQSGDHP